MYVIINTAYFTFLFLLQLPLKIDIIKHPNETDGKSTAVHAKLLAPDDVTIYKYPCIPEYKENRHEVRHFIYSWALHWGGGGVSHEPPPAVVLCTAGREREEGRRYSVNPAPSISCCLLHGHANVQPLRTVLQSL